MGNLILFLESVHSLNCYLGILDIPFSVITLYTKMNTEVTHVDHTYILNIIISYVNYTRAYHAYWSILGYMTFSNYVHTLEILY